MVSKTASFGIMLCVLTIQLPFQNFFLNQTVLSVFGTNISIFTVGLLFIFIIKDIKIKISYVFLIAIFVFVSLYYAFIIDFYAKDTNIAIKIINNSIMYLYVFMVFYVFDMLFKKNTKFMSVFISISFYIFIVLFIYLLMHSTGVFSLDENNILHGFKNLNMRPRLFSIESSMAVTVFITFGIFAVLKHNSFVFKTFLYLSIVIGLFLLQSKGGFIIFSIIAFVYFINLKIYTKVIISVFFILSILFFLEDIRFMLHSFWQKFDDSVSLTTRLTMIVAAICSLFKYPLGVGFGAYLFYFDESIILAKDIVTSICNGLGLSPNFDELNTYLVSQLNYSTKTLLFDCIMFFGWIGAFVFFYFHYCIYKKIREVLELKILFLFLFFSHSCFVNSMYLYHYWAAFAFMYNYRSIKACQKEF